MLQRYLLLALAIALLVYQTISIGYDMHGDYLGTWYTDDAFISLRYAENLAAGHGPVFNPGEIVEGYTAPLWIGLLALGLWFGVPGEVVLTALPLLFAIASLTLIFQAYRIWPGLGARGSAWACLWCASCGVFTGWASSGMEPALLAFELCLLSLLYLRMRKKSVSGWQGLGYLGGCLALTRPEGVMIAALCSADLALLALRKRITWSPFLRFSFGAGILFLPYMIFRLIYFGYPLPNTFYAKVGGSSAQWLQGAEYLVRFLWPTAPFVVLLFLGSVRGFLRGRLLPIAGLFAIYGSYVIYVGGDHMPAFRFLMPLLPILVIVTWRAALRVPTQWMAGGVAVMAVFVAHSYAIAFSVKESEAGGEVWPEFGSGERIAVLAAAAAVFVLLARGLGLRGRILAAIPCGYAVAVTALCYDLAGMPELMQTVVWTLPLVALAITACGLLPSAWVRLGTLVLAAAWGPVANQSSYFLHHHLVMDKLSYSGEAVGRWFRANASPDAVIATNAAGALPYYSALKTIDMLGLNDEHIAHVDVGEMGVAMAGHSKGDGQYVLDRQPEYILFWSALGALQPVFRSDQELWALPRFHAEYQLKTVQLPAGSPAPMFHYFERKRR